MKSTFSQAAGIRILIIVVCLLATQIHARGYGDEQLLAIADFISSNGSQMILNFGQGSIHCA